MALRNDISAGVKADLIAFNSALQDQAYLVMGDTVIGDSGVRFYYYDSASTATIDGENVLATTGMGNVGRYLKSTPPEIVQSDWAETNTSLTSYIKNKPSFVVNVPSAMTSKSLNTAYQISTTQDYRISVSSTISCNLSLSGGQSGSIILEISPNGSSGWIYIGQIDGSNTGTLTIGLNTTQITGGFISTDLPKGYYWRLRTSTITGTPTYSWSGGSQQLK